MQFKGGPRSGRTWQCLSSWGAPGNDIRTITPVSGLWSKSSGWFLVFLWRSERHDVEGTDCRCLRAPGDGRNLLLKYDPGSLGECPGERNSKGDVEHIVVFPVPRIPRALSRAEQRGARDIEPQCGADRSDPMSFMASSANLPPPQVVMLRSMVCRCSLSGDFAESTTGCFLIGPCVLG